MPLAFARQIHPASSRRAHRQSALLCLLLGTAFVLACSSGSGQTITLYNGQHEPTTDALVKAFQKQTGIKVKVRSGDENTLVSQIEQEGGRSPADAIYTENSPALMQLESNKLLAPVAASTLAAVPSADNSPQGDWVGVSARVSVLVYNTKLLTPSQLPTSVLQLADPQWKGKLALAPTETDFQPIVTSVLKSKGQAATVTWLQGLKTNAADHVYPDNETLTSMVDKGQVALGIVDQYYWYREQAEVGASKVQSAIATFAPQDPGYVVDVSGAGVLASSRHQAQAQQLLAFLVSAQGEQILDHSDSFEYPLGSGVTTSRPLTPFNQLQPAPLTIADLGDGKDALRLLQQVQLL